MSTIPCQSFLLFSNEVGTWKAGINSSFNFISPEMEEKVAIIQAKKVYKVVAVMQPPFIFWNETKSIDYACIIH